MDYRKYLYGDYSGNFGAGKAYDAALQHGVYEVIYRELPGDLETAIGDLGCGKGEWLQWMSSRGYAHLTGVDVAGSELAHLGGDGRVRTVEGEVTPVLKGMEEEFDLLHAKDVLEHMTKNETVDFLRSCHGALRKGGELWILTFNAQSPLAGATRYGDFTHESGVTPRSLAQVLRATGFECAEVRGLHVHPGTLKGRLRGAAFGIVDATAGVILRLRHGGGSEDENVEIFSAKPDLFARARKV